MVMFKAFTFLYISRRLCITLAKSVRVRFAPSPTGFLHLGGLRTALYNYLFAKKYDGKFILRLEDTDRKRVVPGSAGNFQDMLTWTGITPEEGPAIGGPYGPYIQSQRLEKYKEKVNFLLKIGAAYRCFCSETRLDLLRKEAIRNRQNPGYDNKCRYLSPSEIAQCLEKNQSFVVRFKLQNGPLMFKDLIYGSCTFDSSQNEGDFIILKSDGFPTYHLSSVVDDHLMNISHVLRGAEWLHSTPKHIMIYQAFKWESPEFGHLPLLINSDKSKLSKRQDSIGIKYFKERGYAPVVLLNFLLNVAGGCCKSSEAEVLELDELHQKFDLSEVRTQPCVMEVRLLDVFNRSYIIKCLNNELMTPSLIKEFRLQLIQIYGSRYKQEAENMSDIYIKRIFMCYKDRINSLHELAKPEREYLWTSPDVQKIKTELSITKLDDLEIVPIMRKVSNWLREIPEGQFLQENLSAQLKQFSKEQKLRNKDVMQMLRIVLTGNKDGPAVAEILCMLGQDRSIRKLHFAIQFCKSELETNT